MKQPGITGREFKGLMLLGAYISSPGAPQDLVNRVRKEGFPADELVNAASELADALLWISALRDLQEAEQERREDSP